MGSIYDHANAQKVALEVAGRFRFMSRVTVQQRGNTEYFLSICLGDDYPRIPAALSDFSVKC